MRDGLPPVRHSYNCNMKHTVGVLVILALISVGQSGSGTAAAASKAQSHNAVWGARGSYDVLLTRQAVREKFKPLRIVSKDFEYRHKADQYGAPRTITQIVITDEYTDGDGGHATLKSGGPGFDYAIIHLKSQRGHGITFTIDIYGQ